MSEATDAEVDPVAGAAPQPRRLLVALVLLYAGQYVATGAIFALPAILRAQGAPLHQVGLISLVTFGTVAKVAWAPLVDRYGRHGGLRRPRGHQVGHYRSWLVVVQPAIAVCLVAMAPLRPREDVVVLFAGACVLAALIGTQDIATDAIAVRATRDQGRGAANAVQVAAGFGGAIAGTTTMLVLTQRVGWSGAISGVAALSLLPLIAVWMLREPSALSSSASAVSPGEGDRGRRPGFRSIVALLVEPGVARWMFLIVPLTWLGIVLPQSVLPPLLVDHGWRLDQLGLVTSTLTGLAGIVGAVLAGGLARRWGRRRVLVAAAVVQLVATAGLLPVATGSGGAGAIAAVSALGVARGITNTVIFTVSMDLTRDATAGSDYTVLTTWGYALAIVATTLGPVLAGAAGYAAVVALALVLSFAAMVAVLGLFADRRADDHGRSEGRAAHSGAASPGAAGGPAGSVRR